MLFEISLKHSNIYIVFGGSNSTVCRSIGNK